MRRSVGQVPTAGEQTQQKLCRMSSDIGVEQENHRRTRSDVGSERVNAENLDNWIFFILGYIGSLKWGGGGNFYKRLF
jgi:hypothetical protein